MRYFLIFLILFTFSFGDDLSTRLENLVKNKKENQVVFLKYNPFQVKRRATNSYKPTIYQNRAKPLRFVMILNHQAFVNGKWFKVGDYIRGYKLAKIGKNQIIVMKNGKKITLGFGTKKNIIKIRENKHED